MSVTIIGITYDKIRDIALKAISNSGAKVDENTFDDALIEAIMDDAPETVVVDIGDVFGDKDDFPIE